MEYMKKFNLTEGNIALIRRVQKALDKNPDKFNMSFWKEKVGECGTTMCIAGWAGELIGKPFCEPMHRDEEKFAQWKDTIAKALLNESLFDPNMHNDIFQVFFAMQWPQPFYNEYYGAMTGEQKVDVAIRRLDYLIETGI